MRRPGGRSVALAIVGVAAVAALAVLGAPGGEGGRSPADSPATTGSTVPQRVAPPGRDIESGEVVLVSRDELTPWCTAQFGGPAEAVWVSPSWSCAGLRQGLWGTELLDLGSICAPGSPRAVTAAGVDCT